jgi:hypothetical protein
MIEDRHVIMVALREMRSSFENNLDAWVGIEDVITRSHRAGLARLNAEIARRSWNTIAHAAADHHHSKIGPLDD